MNAIQKRLIHAVVPTIASALFYLNPAFASEPVFAEQAVVPGNLGEASAGTVLSDTAAAMQPGEWIELQTGGIDAALLDSVQGGVQHILPYADKLHWDPQDQRAYFMNSDDPGDGRRFVAYDEASNQWEVLPDPWGGPGVAHQYGLVDIDVIGRRIYSIMPNSTSGSYFDLATERWSNISVPGGAYSCCGALANFPERGSLVFAHGSTVRERTHSNGQWSSASTNINTSYHAVAHYSSSHNLVVFGGGNDSSRTFYKMTQNGQVSSLGSPPINLESPRVEFVENPVTGDFMVFGIGQRYYLYDPADDRWTAQPASSVPSKIWAGTEFGANLLATVATSIPQYGVSLFVSCAVGGSCSAHLYKFGPALPAPDAPADLNAQ